MNVQALIARIGEELVDPGHVLWSRPSLMAYLNQALSVVVQLQPEAGRQERAVVVTDGRVAAPANAVVLLSVDRAADRAVNYIDITMLSRRVPEWQNHTGAPSAWTQARGQVLSYTLYPRPAAAVTVQDAWAVRPEVVAETDTLPVNAVYVPALMEYVLYRAYGKDGQDEANLDKARAHWQAFNALMGGRAERGGTRHVD